MDVKRLQCIRLLLVEDSRSEATVIRRSLMAGKSAYEITGVETLIEALAQIEGNSFNLILLDLTLPDSFGLTTLKHIVAAAPDVPVVVLTGHEDDGIGLACIKAGAQDYLCKAQMTPDTLRTLVSFALVRHREIQAKLMRMVEQSDNTLSSASSSIPVTQSLAGSACIRERDPAAFADLQAEYQSLLLDYMEYLSKRKTKPKAGMEVLATQFGDLGATPKDMVDAHTFSLEKIRKNLSSTLAYTFAADSRLFALEMMGLLVEYYRIGSRRLFEGRTPS